MKSERRSRVWLFFSMTGLFVWGAAIASFANESQAQGEIVNWHLTCGRVVYPGDTLIIDRSRLMTGYMVEAMAASSNGPVRKGIFRATLTAFSPVARFAGRSPELWYLAGKWTLTEEGQDGEPRHFPRDGVLLEGNLAAEGLLNAMAEHGVFGAPVRFFMTLAGNCPGKGEAVFLGDEGFKGHIRMTLVQSGKDR